MKETVFVDVYADENNIIDNVIDENIKKDSTIRYILKDSKDFALIKNRFDKFTIDMNCENIFIYKTSINNLVILKNPKPGLTNIYIDEYSYFNIDVMTSFRDIVIKKLVYDKLPLDIKKFIENS